MRKKHQEAFVKKHGIKVGFMSAFVKASASALTALPAVNAVIDGNEIVYRDYVDVSVAVATPKVRDTDILMLSLRLLRDITTILSPDFYSYFRLLTKCSLKCIN